MFNDCAVIIPAYHPEPALIAYVDELRERGIQNIIVVDDGSAEDTKPVFRELESEHGCHILVHEVNRGKGRGLKTAFAYLQTERPEIRYIVTADADGQHAVADVLSILRHLQLTQAGLVLGVRDFDEEHVPGKNAFGNKMTSAVFQFLFGKKITDTQTGLRGFSSSEFDWLLQLKGERFEYEMNMLMYAVDRGFTIHEVNIQTLYFGKKPATHYKTIRDSWRIARQLAIGFIMKKRLVEKLPVPSGGE